MATPVGHAVLGLLVAKSIGKTPGFHVGYGYAFAIFAANAADLDFIPGVFLGDINYYHQGPSHSIVAALLFGLISVLFAPLLKISRQRVALLGMLAYLSHLLLDMFVNDARAPYGLPLAWPLSDIHWNIAPLLSGIRHGVPGDSISVFLMEVFSVHNFMAIVKEMAMTMPLFFLVYYIGRVRRSINNTKENA